MASLIRFDGIRIDFKGVPLFTDLNFNISTGDKILLYGRSGIGKTTILRILMGFNQTNAGIVYYNEQPISHKNIWELRRQIAYANQDLDIGEGIVYELIKDIFSCRVNSGIDISIGSIEKYLKLMQLDQEILNKEYVELSGGEKQRIILTIALLLDRPIILLDEPTAFLDIEMKKKIIAHFTNCPATVLAVGHDPQWLERSHIRIIDLESKNANT